MSLSDIIVAIGLGIAAVIIVNAIIIGIKSRKD